MATLNEIDFGSESEDGGDFNPTAAADSGDESGAEKNASPPKKSASKRVSPAVDEDLQDEDDDTPQQNGHKRRMDEDEEGEGEDLRNGDDEDEEEDDDDDEEAVTGRPHKRRRRDPRNQFIDIEAEVDDEDEGDDEDDEAEVGGFIAEDHPDDRAELTAAAAADDRRHRELDRQREAEQQMDAEKQAALLKERYGRRQYVASDVAKVPKRLLLPSVDDPSIWGVRVKPGKEREVVFAITKRLEERARVGKPDLIASAFERAGTGVMAGYVYVEAKRQADVLPAVEGLLHCFPHSKTVLVPIKEMPDLLRVKKSEQLEQGGYVRIKRGGRYQGDVAQIDNIESNGLEVTLRIIPRLDYGLNEDANAAVAAPIANGTATDGKRKRPQAVNAASRPPQRLFSDSDAKKKHGRYLTPLSTFGSGKKFQYYGDMYTDGFLLKDFKIQHLQTEGVNPTLEEVTKFAASAQDGHEELDLSALAASLKKSAAQDSYLPGDAVEVYEGEQAGVEGRAKAVRGDIVTLEVEAGELRGQTVDVPTKGLRKRFREGDHVKVIGGSSYRDEVGMVVRIAQDRVTLLSDMSMQEITVFSKDLRVATDSGVAGGLGRYDIHDLVQLE